MAEPSRKLNKRNLSPIVGASEIANNRRQKEFQEFACSEELVFWTLNQSDPVLIDLTEFSVGKSRDEVKGGRSLWAGDFRGRPRLIKELMPAIRCLHGQSRKNTIDMLLQTLRFWWRVFEDIDLEEETSGIKLNAVNGCEDINIFHHNIAVKKGIRSTNSSIFIRLINFSRAQKGLPPEYWPNVAKINHTSDIPEHWEIERIRHVLKRLWLDVIKRWENADKYCMDIDGWKETHYRERKRHIHEVYRAVIGITKNNLPSFAEVIRVLGFSSKPRWMEPLAEPMAGLYPLSDDVRSAFMLCLIYTGWNVSTLASMNIELRFLEDHPTNKDYHVIFGHKERGNSEHSYIGWNNRQDSPGVILRSLIARTQPLREIVRAQLQQVDMEITKGRNDNFRLIELMKLRKVLAARVVSPWLYVDTHNVSICHVTADSANNSSEGTFLRNVIDMTNRKLPDDKKVSRAIVPGDFRDAYIGFAYEFSNYSVLSAQLAAQHRRAETTRIYLNKRRWKAKSSKEINKFQTFFFNEISERRSVDPTVLKGLMEDGEVSSDARARLEQYRRNRTRLGVGCKNPFKPPKNISPKHAGGGCLIQRCTLCVEHAILLPESYDGLAMRQVELEYLRERIPVTAWLHSKFSDELDNTELALTYYKDDLVLERLKYWRSEIASGRHVIVLMDGDY